MYHPISSHHALNVWESLGKKFDCLCRESLAWFANLQWNSKFLTESLTSELLVSESCMKEIP